MTKKRLLLLIICSILILLFGCGFDPFKKKQEIESTHTDLMRVVCEGYIGDEGFYQCILYDPSTRVMYSFVGWFQVPGNLCQLVNADGTPEIYSPNKSYSTMKVVDEGYIGNEDFYQCILYDSNTKVMYSFVGWFQEPGNLCQLVNADGTPRLYS